LGREQSEVLKRLLDRNLIMRADAVIRGNNDPLHANPAEIAVWFFSIRMWTEQPGRIIESGAV
jgi:hypothetical protein